MPPSRRDRPPIRVRLFASPSEEPRARRPTDVALLILNLVVLATMLIAESASRAAEDAIADLVSAAPVLLAGMWDFFGDLVVVWALGLIVIAVVARHRLSLVRDLVLAAAAAAVLALLGDALVGGDNPSLGSQLTASGGPESFPALRLAIVAAVIIAASPHLGRPLRHAGRWIIGVGALSTLILGVASVGGVIAAIAVAGVAAAAVHLVFGSPGGRPSLNQLREALAELGVEARELQDAALQPEGVWTVLASRDGGSPIRIKVYGRDAWDGQLVMSLWRSVWFRESDSRLATSRTQLVEHEAFLILLARQAGIRVPTVVAAGRSRTGDAVLVVTADDVALDDIGAPDDALLADLWRSLELAHDTGVSPGRIDPHTIGAGRDGRATLLDWVSGQTAPSNRQQLQDGAQLLISTAMLVGNDRAIAAAADTIGADRFAELLPYLQPAGLPRTLRRAADELDYDVKELRAAASEHLGVEVPDLVRLRRVTLGSLVQAALLVFVAIALVDGLSSIDFEAVGDELRDMAWGAAAVALVLAQLARACGALSNLGASPAPLPLGPLVQLQFAISYVNMAIPSSAGRLAVVMRFYQRVGSTAVTALGASAVDSLANFIVQVVLVVGVLAFGLGTIELNVDDIVAELPDSLARLVLVVAVAFVVGVAVVLLVPRLRRKFLPSANQLRAGFAVLKNPRNGLLLLGGNLLVQIGYSLSLGAFVGATGYDVGLIDLLLIINLVGTFASIIPVPNGMGVSEAGLLAGLVAVGVPEQSALAAVLAYRVASAYLPPVAGFFSMRWLQRHDYL